MQPKPEYLQLFSEMILEVWKQKQSQAAGIHATIQNRLTQLRKRKDLLVEAFVYKKALDQKTYQEQFDKLNEEITLVEIEEQDARLDALDVESAVEFSQYVLLHAARLWAESGPDQKQRLQKLIFPKGVSFLSGVYGTDATSSIFFDLDRISAQKEGLVALPGNVTCTSQFSQYYWQNPSRYWLLAPRPKITLSV